MSVVESPEFDCPHGERCGGCAFLGTPYRDQLTHKETLVRARFTHFPQHHAIKIPPVDPAFPTQAYRARAKLVRTRTGELGLYARDSHDVIDIPHCRVLAPQLLAVAAAARCALTGSPVDALDLRLVDRGVLVTLIAPRGTSKAELSSAAQALSSVAPEVVGVAASFRAADAATVLGDGHLILLGNEVEPHHLSAGAPYHLAAHGAFVQVHLGQADRAHAAIERALRDQAAHRVLELYAGSGALALRLAQSGFKLTAVESFAPALAHAAQAAREQALDLRTVCAPAERAIAEFVRRGEHFDAVIVNPPRRGVSPAVRTGVVELSPKVLVYMSCDAATLARDLSHFALHGFNTCALASFDMIPHSDAVECLAVARRASAPELQVLHDGEALIVVQRSAYEPLARLTERVRELPGARDAEPLFPFSETAGGLTPFARLPAACEALRAAVSVEHLGLARGITHKKGNIRRRMRPVHRTGGMLTTYERLSVHGGHSLVRVTPDGLAEEPVCRHFASIGHPLLGDARFGDRASNTFFEHRHGLDRIFLHCAKLRISLPQRTIELELPLPGELACVLESASEKSAPRRE